ncbi:methionine/alanine import family NSS transporter small subunit [Nocardioides caldifontis]|nr:methionine/alanine import family NSS transporter small subunit [Nocardioides caldifontis]
MSAEAIVMMVVAMVVLWGGLALALLNLARSPDLPESSEVHRDL